MRGRSKAYNGRAIATLLILLMGFSTLPITNASNLDTGDLYHLQAQDISADFDSATELTTITWRNIDSLDQPNALDNFFNAVYKVYRHSEIIDSQNIVNATLVAEVDACDSETYSVKYLCLGGANGSHPGHSFSYLVAPGTNDSFYYGITTSITAQDNSVSTYDSLISNESATYEATIESTTPIRSPYNLQANFNPTTSITTLSWINYNDIFFILPETGPNAYETRVWQSFSPINRNTSQTVLASATPVAELSPGISTYQLQIPLNTDREVYYAITYVLPNYLEEGQLYQDIRFLSNNALPGPFVEDNMPPSPVSSVNANFQSNPSTGDGITTVTWQDLSNEDGENYAIYSSGEAINRTDQFGAEQIGLVGEEIGEFDFTLPVGRLGTSHYCVVAVDKNGIYDREIQPQSCSSTYENAFYDWIAEPTQVTATFLGESQTLITWNDQLGAEGEKYHIWRSNYLVAGSQFVENVTVEYQGTVTDGIQQFMVDLPSEQDRTSFYFVTSEALYQHNAGPYHYTSLIQNWAGPVYEYTQTPNPARINELQVDGEIKLLTVEWLNDPQLDFETYSIWRHTGNPFGENEDQVSITNIENGWEVFDATIIDTGSSITEFKFTRTYNLPADVEMSVWYAIVVEDEAGNVNLESFPGSGGNALKVKEDTVPPTANYTLYDDNGEIYTSSSLTSGSYSIHLLSDEYLLSAPTISLVTSTGGDITNSARQMLLYADNYLNPNIGPEYYLTFDVQNSVSAGMITIETALVDESYNSNTIQWEDRSLDAQNPVLSVYSPSSMQDGSKYLYGNKITINSGASDDVEISTVQYKFTYNYATGDSSTTPWTFPTNLQSLDEDNKTVVFSEEISAGNFEPGTHAVSIRAIDSAGNEVVEQIIFIVDYCRNRIDGTTVCNYEESLKPEPEPIVVEPSYSDPPYVFVWVTSSIAFLAIILMLLVISSGMRGPKKKKSDDEYDDDDWMSEFIGTSQDVDMDSITNTNKSLPVEEEEKTVPDVEEPEDKEEDPFAVNVLSRKSRRTKAKAEPEPEDDDDSFFGLDDDDFDDDEVEEKPKPRRKVGRRVAPKNAPKRRPTRRKKSDD